MPSVQQRFASNCELARSFGPGIAGRGVLQHFFVSPALPLKPLNIQDISDAWTRLVAEIKSGRAPELLTLYVHIPFCTHKCSYCVFHSIGDFEPQDLERYLKRLHQEIDHYSDIFEGVRFANSYIGGGTPSVLDESQLDELLGHLGSAFARRRGGERAFECNPLTVTAAKARILKKHGINRVSFGVQSLNPAILNHVNRGYQSIKHIAETFRIMKACNFWINVDLIHGLPNETYESTEYSLRRILEFGPSQVTINALSPYTPLEPKNREIMPLRKLAGNLEKTVRDLDYRIKVHSTCLDVSYKQLGQDLLAREWLSAGECFQYDDTTVEPFSLLGLGPTARSYIYGQLTYSFDPYPVTAPFDPLEEVAMGRLVTMSEERRRFVVYRLASQSGLHPAEYSARFGTGLYDDFGNEIEALMQNGLLKTAGETVMHASGDPTERFAAELFFVDDRMLQTVVGSAGGHELSDHVEEEPEELDLLLQTPGAEVRVVLTEYWPGRPCFHHRGQYAFFIPSDMPEGTCRHNPLEESLLDAFRLLFDGVIAASPPRSLESLHSSLFAKGPGISVAISMDRGIHRPPVLLSGRKQKD